MDKRTLLKVIKELFEAKKTTYEIGKVVHLSLRTVERHEKELRDRGEIGYRKDFLSLETPSSRQYKTKYYGAYTGMIGTLRDTLGKVEPYEVVKPTIKKIGDTLNVQISDWHVGRKNKDEEGNVIYDERISRERVDRYCTELLNLLDKYISKGTPITNVNILSTGDILDGAGIFAIQETVSELSPPFQVIIAAEVIQKLILAFRARKLKVAFYGVKGNHGEIRIGGKSRDPNSNWDLMLYLMLDFWVRGIGTVDKNITIHYSELDYLNFVNRGWNYHIRHKAPIQSETAAGKAKFLGWVRKHLINVLIYGHYHHWGVWDRSRVTICRGGSLSGIDDLSESMGEESDTVQLVWGCNERRPLTFLYPIDLGSREK